MTKAEKINIAIGAGQLLIGGLLFLGYDRKSMPDFHALRTWLVLLFNLGGWAFIIYAVSLSRMTAQRFKQAETQRRETEAQLEIQRKETAAYKREVDELYADVVLDWLQQNHPMIFAVPHVAKKMQYDEGKISRGLEILEKEFKVVQNNGPRGWTYNPMLAIPLICQVKRVIPPQNSN